MIPFNVVPMVVSLGRSTANLTSGGLAISVVEEGPTEVKEQLTLFSLEEIETDDTEVKVIISFTPDSYQTVWTS